MSDKSDEILTENLSDEKLCSRWRTLCPTNNFVRRKFCPTLFCPKTYSMYCGISSKKTYKYNLLLQKRKDAFTRVHQGYDAQLSRVKKGISVKLEFIQISYSRRNSRRVKKHQHTNMKNCTSTQHYRCV